MVDPARDDWFHVLLQAFGDNVISLALLDQLPGTKRLLGTGLTADVMTICGFDRGFELTRVFAGIPAFYDLRKRGPLRAVRDGATLLRALRAAGARQLHFEKADFRSVLFAALVRGRARAPGRKANVYADRRAVLEELYGARLRLAPLAAAAAGRRVLINPASRLVRKNVAEADLGTLIDLLQAAGKSVTLIDYDGRLGDFRERVDDYRTGTTLVQAADLLRATDYYIGADSFFVHLAYVFARPFFVFLNQRNDYFMPPGCLEAGNYLVRGEIAGELRPRLESDFARLGWL